MNKPSEKLAPNEPALAASEKRFRALVTATSDIIYRMSPDWRVMHQLDGRGFLTDTREPIADWMEKYILPVDQEQVKAAINEATRSRKMFQLEHRVIRANGKVGWTLSRAVPITNEEGDVIEWFGAADDISERKQTEEALREAKERSEQQKRLYEAITSGTPDLIYVFDLDYRFIYANDALLSMWGKTWDNAIGKGLRENGYEEWHALMHEQEIDEVRATKRSIRGEVSFPHATLGRRIYDYIFTPVLDERGAVEAVAGTTRDITDIRNAEMAVSESEERFRNMAESLDVMISVSDDTGSAVYFNEAWTNLTGRTPAELLQDGWVDLIHPEDRDRVINIYASVFLEKKPWQWEFRMPDRQGGYRWLLTRGAPRFRSDGFFAGYISSTVDITAVKENDQRKNDFISMVSHELKTPLTSAISYVQVSEEIASAAADTVTAGMLDRAGKQLGKMTRMINNFLDVSRLESGKIHLQRQRFDMGILLKEAEEESNASVTSHKITFGQAVEIWVEADRERIGHVISNLISNAVKYSPGDSGILVTCKTMGDQVQVSVADEGMGISEDDLPRIFDRFYRVKANVAKHIAGFGIGLYLCREIVREHNGDIRAESTPGKGSTFYFTLPVEAG